MPLFVRILFVVALFTITLLIILSYTFRVVVSQFGALVGIWWALKKDIPVSVCPCGLF